MLPISGQPLLLHNETGNQNNWVGLRLRGTYSNRDSIGASVVIDACGKKQYDSVRSGGSYISEKDPRLHFGLGTCAQVDSVTVKWPRGGTQVEKTIPVNKYSVIEEKKHVSLMCDAHRAVVFGLQRLRLLILPLLPINLAQ